MKKIETDYSNPKLGFQVRFSGWFQKLFYTFLQDTAEVFYPINSIFRIESIFLEAERWQNYLPFRFRRFIPFATRKIFRFEYWHTDVNDG